MNKNILKAPSKHTQEDLVLALSAINKSFPLKTVHKKALPGFVQELSLMLTSERGQMQTYWQKPSLTGAYLYYFLPWNLLRLSWLLPNLPISIPAEGRMLDLGSGPLTLSLGLWLAKPLLRKQKLLITCADTAPRPMELGRSIINNLPNQAEYWDIHLLRSPIESALRKAGRVNFISAGNVLNELQSKHRSLEERLEEIFYSMDRSLEEGGQIFLLEPGTRLGGKIISAIRQLAIQAGYHIQAPCTHAQSCPYAPANAGDALDNSASMFGRKNNAKAFQRQSNSWCHFRLTAEGAPSELVSLSRAASLEKERLSLSFLLLRKPDNAQMVRVAREQAGKGGIICPARVLSDPIRIPGNPHAMRYVCTTHGLGLLSNAGQLQSGSLVNAFLPDKAKRDAKSNALLMEPVPYKKKAR